MSQIATLYGLKCPHCGSEHLTVTGIKGALGASAATSLAFGAVGNIVAGKKAMSNANTEPLQYKCESCSAKFESFPIEAPPEETLEPPCTVSFTRERSMVGAAVPQVIYLNGIKMGAVKNGESVSFSTYCRHNAIFVTDQFGVAFKGDYRFEAQPGGSVSVHFRRGFVNMPEAAYAEPAHAVTGAQFQSTIGVFDGVRFCTNCGRPMGVNTQFCGNCGETRFVPLLQSAMPAPAAAVPTALSKPTAKKAVVAFGMLAASWLLIILLQGLSYRRLLYSADITFFVVAAMLGVGVYLSIQKETVFKLLGLASGLIISLFYAGTMMATMLNSRTGGLFSVANALNFRYPYFWELLGRAAIIVFLPLACAFVIGLINKAKKNSTVLRVAAGFAAAAYLLCRIIPQLRTLIAAGFIALTVELVGVVGEVILLYLSVKCCDSLCKSGNSHVELYGAGKVWAWIALFGMVVSIGSVLAIAFGAASGMAYTASLLLAICGALGYILLLCKKRVGLYFVVGAAVLVLGGQFLGSLSMWIYGANQHAALLLSSVLGMVNPLFAWLAVRAADRRGYGYSRPAPVVNKRISGFHKFTAVFNIVVGALLIIPIIGNIIDRPDATFLLVFTIFMLIYLTFGILAVSAQHSPTRQFSTWMKVIDIILFFIAMLVLAFMIVGITVSALK